MKEAEKKKPIPTIPAGVWESSRPKNNSNNKNNKCTVTTDLQGNGYPKKQGK